MFRTDRVAGQMDDLDVGLRLLPFLAQGLAPGAGQGGQEGVEAVVAVVFPMKLTVLADKPASAFEQADLIRRHEGRMGRTDPVPLHHLLCGPD